MRLEFDSVATAPPPVSSESLDDFGLHDGNGLEALLKKGVSAAQGGDRETARKVLSQASAIDPNCENAWMWLASISEYPEELLAFLDRVLSINPDNARAIEWRQATRSLLAKNFVQRAVAARDQENKALAERCVDQAIEFDANFAPAWFVRAAMAEDDDQKLGFLDRVLELDPEHDDAKAAVAAIYGAKSQAAFEEAKQAAMAGDQGKALEILDVFLEAAPDSVEAWILKSHLSSGLEQKIEALERALEIDPENAAARSGLAFLALTFGSSKKPADEETASYSEPEVETSDPFSDQAETFAREECFSPAQTVESVAIEDPSLSAQPDDCGDEAPDLHVEQHSEVDAKHETVEYASPFESKVTDEDSFEARSNGVTEPAGDDSAEENNGATGHYIASATRTSVVACPFCGSKNEEQAFDCQTCNAQLTLSDIEALLAERSVNHDFLQAAVTQMEAEWNLREFNHAEMTNLGIGHFNLGNFDTGLKYLQEASRLDANNVILAGQVNALAIRVDEISRQNEVNETRVTGKTILVVDDSPTVRKLISGKLEKSGHVVVCASDGVEALEHLETGIPDLVLLDITMPRMDGYEVCKHIRANPQAKDLPVVMISGKDGFFDKVRGRMAGSTGYVTKPFGPETLMKALETYLLPEA